MFSHGAIKPPANNRPPSFPKLIRAHDIVARPPLVSHVDGAEEKGYEHLPPLDESVAAHLCPSTAIGWKAMANHPSKPCRATSALAGHAYSAAGQVASALHSMAVLQVYQAKMLASEEASLDAASLRDLRSTTDLALHATKATAQAIGRSMSSLIVLERHLWLTMAEMKEADKVPLVDAPFHQAACLDQLWRALLNASRRLRSRLKRCNTSSLSTPAPSLATAGPPRKQPLNMPLTTLLNAGCRGKCVFISIIAPKCPK